MILYFTATGNSEYVAKKMAKELGEETKNLFSLLRGEESGPIFSEQPWIVVVPTYAWRIPRLVENYLSSGKLEGNREMYFVMTCGDGNGNAWKYCKKLCQKLGMVFRGCASLILPENYIALFDAPQEQEAVRIVQEAQGEIALLIQAIKDKKSFPQPEISWKAKWQSALLNPLFYAFTVKDKKFYVKEGCISCKKCLRVCPVNNIAWEQNHPVWQGNCTHCMACICHCPQEVIEYGTNTLGKARYLFPKQLQDEWGK